MRNILLLPVMIAALTLTGCGAATPIQTPTPTPVMAVFEVLANVPWQDTGLRVNAGDLVTIQYSSGSWTTWSGSHPFVDGDGNIGLGDPKNPEHPVSGAYPGVLIAKVGDEIPREIGNQKEFRPCASGPLYLQMNDDILSDNEGSIVVQISVSASADQVPCDPPATPVPISDWPTPVPVPPDLSMAPDLSRLIDVQKVTSASPYGKWRAEAILAFFATDTNVFDYARLTLTRDFEGLMGWMPYEEWTEGGLGDSFISDFYWSPDERYLYFTHEGVVHPCGFPFTTNLRRVDLEDGSLMDIPLTGLGLDDITISPGAERLVYRVAEGLLVYELESGSARILPFQWPQDYRTVVGPYAWSPDRSELGFVVAETLCGMPGELLYSLQVINVETGAVRPAEDQDSWLYLPEKISPDPVPTASLVLHEFLNSLYWAGRGRQDDYTYQRAADLYGGSYETLIEMNPDIDPNDHASLLRRACEVNGFQCLRLRDVISSQAMPGEGGSRVIQFAVYLMNPDGSIFVRGMCCGGETGLPQTRFNFAVRQMEDGAWKALDLPPYVP